MSVIIEITQITLDYLRTIVPDVECRRSNYPSATLEELEAIGKPLILVVPVERTGSMCRPNGVVQHDIAIDLCINSKLSHIGDEIGLLTEEIDSLIEMSEMIYAHFHKVEKTNEKGFQAIFMNPEYILLNDFEMIRTNNSFWGAIRIHAKAFTKQTLE
jgi:hypothetical protein